jgi:signal transduction histidine kinase
VAAGDPEELSESRLRLFRAIADNAAAAVRALNVMLAVEQGYLKAMVEHFPEGVLLLDSNMHPVLANPLAGEYLRALAPEGPMESLTRLADCSIRDLLGPPPHGALYHELETSEPAPRVFETEAQPMKLGPAGDGWLLVLREITREREVQQRAQQQEQLAAVGQLAAGIAHDFNNLLMGMIGFGQLLQLRPGIPEAAKADLERIVDLGQRAARLVRQILDFSRRSLSRRNPFDLALFLKETTKFLQRTIPESISIHLDVSPGEFFVNGDPAQIRQIITNLALNSRDAMPGGGELLIRLSRLELAPGNQRPFRDMASGEWVVLSMSDSGSGIPPDVMPHIFEPFFTTKEIGKGTGLGMAQAYGIVKQHDGFTDVRSEEGRGTTVTIYFPAFASGEKPAGKLDRDASRIPRGNGELILLVEDEPEVLQMSMQMLESLGYKVAPATNGQEALVLFDLRRTEIALVITDMVMPELGGMELSQQLKKKYPKVKTIMLSGYPLEDDPKALLEMGIATWLQKPVNVSEMAQAIGRMINS